MRAHIVQALNVPERAAPEGFACGAVALAVPLFAAQLEGPDDLVEAWVPLERAVLGSGARAVSSVELARVDCVVSVVGPPLALENLEGLAAREAVPETAAELPLEPEGPDEGLAGLEVRPLVHVPVLALAD